MNILGLIKIFQFSVVTLLISFLTSSTASAQQIQQKPCSVIKRPNDSAAPYRVNPVQPNPRSTDVIRARPRTSRTNLDVNCGSEKYTISTGTEGGNCSVTAPGSGGGGGGICADGNNGASVSCDTGCVSSSGSGSCTGPN